MGDLGLTVALAASRRQPTTAPKPLHRREASIISPLRYPGGKRRLWAYVAEVLKINEIHPKLFIEPFAGGASVSLQLLVTGLVDNIALGERDPFVASFWKEVFEDSDWLIERVRNLRIDVRTWRFFKRQSFSTHRDRALACLFLNRTSFSGILAHSSGPIGGQDQASEYKIDCRFPRETIVRRIEQASALADRVAFIIAGDWRKTIARARKANRKPSDTFYYIDPPFYFKARRLYAHYFTNDQHRALADFLVTVPEPWLLSYDVAPPILRMYSRNGTGPRRIDILYSAGSIGLVRAKELIITNLRKLPVATRLWRSSTEWRRDRQEKRIRSVFHSIGGQKPVSKAKGR